MKVFNITRSVCLAMTVIAVSACSGGSKEEVVAQTEGEHDVDELYIVDCLLPGQLRKLGSMTYMSPRRPIRTTKIDCEIRGGEYVAYDRADYRTALKVWLAKAEEGDAEAQNYVGEIFEKGLGQEPDYVSAVAWYQKAADQNYSRAQINLGYMYEQGNGVDKDVIKALNLYRQASGVPNDEIIFASSSEKELKQLERNLKRKIIFASAERKALKEQLALYDKKVKDSDANRVSGEEVVDLKNELKELKALYAKSQLEKNELDEQLQGVSIAYRNVKESPILAPNSQDLVDERTLKDINFGRFYAIIIGNEDYLYFDKLRSPMRDAYRLKEVLEEQYGFTTLILPNADEKIILNTLNDLSKKLTKNDNLLVYYAGHGNVSDNASMKIQRGYWLPVDAKKESISNWINNAVINDHLDRLAARSVLVVADSCYAGQMGAESSSFLFGINAKLSEASIRHGLKKRARVVISSGGVKPVVDGTFKDHSVFALSLADVLEKNDTVLRDSNLYAQLAVNVKQRNRYVEIKQNPEMKPIRSAGHEGGSFYFIPNGIR